MTFEQQREIAIKLAANAGLRSWSSQPPAWRLLWRFGVRIPPPLFMNAWGVALTFGIYFALFWGAMQFVAWLIPGLSHDAPFILWELAGLMVGALVACLHATRRHNLGLPTWRDLRSALILA